MSQKKITTISIDEMLLTKCQELAPFFGHRSLSSLVEELLKAWLETGPQTVYDKIHSVKEAT
jgi:hypothetical protein